MAASDDAHARRCALSYVLQSLFSIRLKDLRQSTDIEALARFVLRQCPMIPIDRLEQLEQLLFYLQKRGGTMSDSSSATPPTPPTVSMAELDVCLLMTLLNNSQTYIELLYEDVAEKTRATAAVLQLSLNEANLEQLVENGQ